MGEKEWYFFSLKDRKYPTGLRTNRATSAGYWKITGKDKEIFNGHTSELIGMKKTLVFYKGRAPGGEKTYWVMHEYCLQSKTTFEAQKEWVVCRVFKKSSREKTCPSNQPQPDQKLQKSSAFMPSVMQAKTYQLAGMEAWTDCNLSSAGMGVWLPHVDSNVEVENHRAPCLSGKETHGNQI